MSCETPLTLETVRLGECMGEWRRLGSVGYYKARISLEGIPSARGGAMATAPAAPDRIRRAGAPRGNPHRGHRTRSTWPILLMVTRCDATAPGTECAGCSRDWRVATRILPPAAPSSDDTRLSLGPSLLSLSLLSLSLLSLITRRSFVVTCFERRDVSDEGRRKRTEAPETLRVCHERARCPASEPAAAFSEPQGR